MEVKVSDEDALTDEYAFVLYMGEISSAIYVREVG
jgi:hypothetical protein